MRLIIDIQPMRINNEVDALGSIRVLECSYV